MVVKVTHKDHYCFLQRLRLCGEVFALLEYTVLLKCFVL